MVQPTDFGSSSLPTDERRAFLRGSVGMAGLLGLGALLAACDQGEQGKAPAPEPGPEKPVLPPTLEETRPLEPGLSTRVRESKEFARFAPAFAKLDAAPDLEHAVEAVYSGLPAAATGSRTVIVPLVGPGGEKMPQVWMMTLNGTGREGSEIIQVLPENRFRFLIDPDLATGFELVYDASSGLVGLVLIGQISPYLQCVFALIALMIGVNPGTIEACATLCSAGGITNPGCLACIGAAAGVALAAWWAC